VRLRRRRGQSAARQGRSRPEEGEPQQSELRLTQRREVELRRAVAENEAVSLPLLHRRFNEVVAKRVGGDKPIPQGFDSIVAVLSERLSQGVPPPPGLSSVRGVAPSLLPSLSSSSSRAHFAVVGCGGATTSGTLGDAEATRSTLRNRQAEVRRAFGKERDPAIAARDDARRNHVAALREAQEVVLRTVDTGGTLASLEARIVTAEAALTRAETALATARNAATEDPKLGSRAPPPRSAEGEVDSNAVAAVQSYHEYVRACSSARMVNATDAAVLAVREELRRTPLFLPGRGVRVGVQVRARRRALRPTDAPAQAEACDASDRGNEENGPRERGKEADLSGEMKSDSCGEREEDQDHKAEEMCDGTDGEREADNRQAGTEVAGTDEEAEEMLGVEVESPTVLPESPPLDRDESAERCAVPPAGDEPMGQGDDDVDTTLGQTAEFGGEETCQSGREDEKAEQRDTAATVPSSPGSPTCDGRLADKEPSPPPPSEEVVEPGEAEVGEVVSLVDGGAVRVSFPDGTSETVPNKWIEEVLEGNDAAVNALDERVRAARMAIEKEVIFWQGLDQVATFPSSQLLAAGRAEVALRAATFSALRNARSRYAALSAELVDEEEALVPERTRDPAVTALAAAADAHLDASDALQDAAQAVQRARIRGRPVEPLEERANEAKDAAKRADAEVREAMLRLAESMRRFPEVGSDSRVLKHLRISLPQDLMPLWCVGRTLAHFDTRELLPGASRHRLFCATEGSRKYAVKEYAIAGGHEGLRVCLHEAALLKRARHPHIVEIVAIFADPDEHGFFIQMPFYEQGSLDRWVAEHRPDDKSIRRVLAQVVTALAHLHGVGITHADIKPGNILLDRRGIARLGDFDISVDSNVRTSAARAQATMTSVGFTPGFAAPELLRTGASPASDVFALGATIKEVAPPSPERDALLQRMQALDPFARPVAQQILQDPFFAPAFAWARDERRLCCICLDDNIPLEDGLECGCGHGGDQHFVCRPCLEQHVDNSCNAELRLRQATEGRVRCPGRPCDAAPYPDADLAKNLSAVVFRRYSEARLDLLEQRKTAELEGQMQARLDAELRRLQALDEQQRRVRAVRNHIVEEILTLKCPRCGQAFLDFVGCFALQCSRCPCGFCAWCGADSGGNNAHEHVRNCREKPLGADVFFGSFEQFEAAQRRRRTRLLQRFLPTLDAQTRHAVLNEIRRDLLDLGLVAAVQVPVH